MIFSFIYTPLQTLDQAKALARSLVSENLAACVNVVPHVISYYQDGTECCETSECVLLIKTLADKETAVLAFLEKHHPYKTPAILTFSGTCNTPFYAWMKQQLF